jgi:hypothetical protein
MAIEIPENVTQTFGDEQPRYFVMRIGGGPARKPYPNRYSAESDAIKLAGENPGAEFALVKVKAIYRGNAIVATGSDDGEQVPDGIVTTEQEVSA